MKKISALGLIGVLVLTLVLAGCSSSDKSNGEVDADGKVPMNVFVHQGSDMNLATNKFTKKMEEKFNIKFNWTTVPFDGAAEKDRYPWLPGTIQICTCSSLG